MQCRRILGKLLKILVCCGIAYLYFYQSQDMPWFTLQGAAFRCMIPIGILCAIMFLIELVTGKDF